MMFAKTGYDTNLLQPIPHCVDLLYITLMYLMSLGGLYGMKNFKTCASRIIIDAFSESKCLSQHLIPSIDQIQSKNTYVYIDRSMPPAARSINQSPPLVMTHVAIPANTNPIPNHVLAEIIFPSTYHSPSTVNKNAIEFVIGTVNESSKSSTTSR